jgi:hypothetical protein
MGRLHAVLSDALRDLKQEPDKKREWRTHREYRDGKQQDSQEQEHRIVEKAKNPE